MGNQLEVIVKESGLEQSKAQYILDNFKDAFQIAADWEIKAKNIVVTSETQTAEMQMARAGRLFLKEKRIDIENARKRLKEQSLREGKAIDGIANVLKGLIVPIEEHLERQEKFAEFKEKERLEQERIALEKKIEEERIAKEKADAEEREKMRIENERLKKEAESKEKERLAEKAKNDAERMKQEEALAKAKRKIEAERAKADAEKRAIEEKAQKEKEAAEAKAKKEREAERAKADAERAEKERLAEILKNQIECPKCHYKFQLNKGA
jgi:hypothetical protein